MYWIDILTGILVILMSIPLLFLMAFFICLQAD